MGMLLHCGAERAEWEIIESVRTPAPTASHVPIPHHELVNRVREALPNYGLSVTQEEHALSKDHQTYFGLMRVSDSNRGDAGDQFSRVVGIRNSHNKRLAAGLVSGSHVFVCDNLAFSGEVQVHRKHTAHIFDALPEIIDVAVGRLRPLLIAERQRFEAYRNFELGAGQEDFVDVLLMSMMRKGALAPSALGKVWEHWENPPHKEFKERNMWSLFNSVTEAYKGTGVRTLYNRSRLLHSFCDEVVEFAPVVGDVSVTDIMAEELETILH
jgi:hypothetical protein